MPVSKESVLERVVCITQQISQVSHAHVAWSPVQILIEEWIDKVEED